MAKRQGLVCCDNGHLSESDCFDYCKPLSPTPESQQAALERHAVVAADLAFFRFRHLLVGRSKMSRRDRKRVNRLKRELKELTNGL